MGILANLSPLSIKFSSHAKEACRAADIARIVALFMSTNDTLTQGWKRQLHTLTIVYIDGGIWDCSSSLTKIGASISSAGIDVTRVCSYSRSSINKKASFIEISCVCQADIDSVDKAFREAFLAATAHSTLKDCHQRKLKPSSRKICSGASFRTSTKSKVPL
jgi:hypothetical protein